MGWFDRIALVAKGKIKVWRRGDAPTPGSSALDRELSQARPSHRPNVVEPTAPLNATSGEGAEDGYERGRADPDNPIKRTL